MSNGRLAVPGQVNMDVQMHSGPNAQHTLIQLQGPAGVVQHVFGGFTKLEHAALGIAAALSSKVEQTSFATDEEHAAQLEAAANLAVELAKKVLEKCERSQQPPKVAG